MTNLVDCLSELRGQGLLDNTVVIITSDHGEAFGDHGHFGHSKASTSTRSASRW